MDSIRLGTYDTKPPKMVNSNLLAERLIHSFTRLKKEVERTPRCFRRGKLKGLALHLRFLETL